MLSALCACALIAAQPLAAAPPGDRLESRDLARQLSAVMTGQHLDAIAAKDPQTDGGFVAALLYPGSQLLVVGAKCPAPAYLDSQIQARAFRDAYAALQQSAVADTKLFVQDLGADGLHAADGQPVDVVYDKVVNQSIFDGDPSHKDHGYEARLAAADARYSRLLQVLLDAAQHEPQP
jgi:hypothetical protein